MKFDYIVIGAGSAGCVLANRLSENPKIKVLLLEAGGRDTKLEIKIPAAYGKLNYSNVDWGFRTEPQTHVDNREMYQPRGKVLGGSSATNAMAYVRGNHADYDDWARMGATGWAHKDVLPYFKKSENNAQFENDFHAKGGLLHVTEATKYRTPLADAFVQSCGEQGIVSNPDFNGKTQEGAGHFQFTIKNGVRESTATAFLTPFLSRPNLKVLTGVQVKKILLEKDRAVGVEFFQKNSKNNTEKVFCNQEIILSAGAFGSPQLLMLSGIGDPRELRKQHIESKIPLQNVGKNLHDHLMFGVSGLSTWRGTMNIVQKPVNMPKHILSWLIRKRGPLTISPLESNAFVKTNPKMTQPDLQIMFVPGHMGDEHDLANGVDIYRPETYPKTDGFTLLPTLLQPKSRGEVSLRSNNPFESMRIQPNYLSHEDDRQTLIKGYRLARKIMESKGFSPFLKEIHYPRQAETEEEILIHIRRTLECVYHPVGTCRMGDSEANSVVDSTLRVRGVRGLRVADASVMPKITSGNTNAPVIMIGEKAADFLLNP